MKTAITLLCLFSIAICAYIEQLNIRCGSILPNRDVIDGGSKEWRYSPTGEQIYRLSVLRQEPASASFSVPLTIQQKEEYQAWRKISMRHNHLHDTVETAGLLQYILVPMGLLLTALRIRNHGWHWIYSIPIVMFGIAGWRMLALSYFTSLGD
jgi:hypothetical protein